MNCSILLIIALLFCVGVADGVVFSWILSINPGVDGKNGTNANTTQTEVSERDCIDATCHKHQFQWTLFFSSWAYQPNCSFFFAYHRSKFRAELTNFAAEESFVINTTASARNARLQASSAGATTCVARAWSVFLENVARLFHVEQKEGVAREITTATRACAVLGFTAKRYANPCFKKTTIAQCQKEALLMF